ncbi:toxin VasX [Burkholderia multivorans]|uniref:toxin VasX n=1 Tax=Burkholderia multivorans TaxID=87883 RepID=UPI00286FB4E9|nr:toxin VasX [Burkholderia multivorans]
MTKKDASLALLEKAKAIALDDCEFCQKSGLAILPIRAAVMRRNAGAPNLPRNLQPVDGQAGKSLSLTGPAAAYTGRTLREGFLYVYDERGTWEKYWITRRGYLRKH